MNSEGKQFNRKVIVGVLLASSFVAILNQTLLIVAITPIMEAFAIEPNQAQWVTTAFLLMNGIMVPISAFLIERFSSRHLLITAISIFSFGTLLGAIAPNFAILLTARVIQAMGAGILMPLMQTIMLLIFPVEKRGAAMGMTGLVIGFAPAIGPTLGGWIIVQFTWRHLFYIVFPITVLVLLAAIFLMKNVSEQKNTQVDIISIILSSLGWGGLLYGFSMVGSVGWSDLSVTASIGVGAITLFFFIRRQLQMEEPMLNFRVFQSKEFTITTILSVIMFALLIGIETLLPIYVQNIKGESALAAGAMLLPGAIIMGAMSPISGRLFDKYGAREMSIIGFTLKLLATIFYITIDMETSTIFIACIFAIQLFGMSFLMTPLMTSGLNALQRTLIPHGAAVSNTLRMVGGSIGTAIMVSIMSGVANTANNTFDASSMLQGMQLSFICAGIAALIGLALSFTLQKKAVRHQIQDSNYM